MHLCFFTVQSSISCITMVLRRYYNSITHVTAPFHFNYIFMTHRRNGTKKARHFTATGLIVIVIIVVTDSLLVQIPISIG